MSLVLHALRGDESLDLGSFGVRLCAFLLGGYFATDDEFAAKNILAPVYSRWSTSDKAIPNIVVLGQTEESSNLGGTLGTEALGIDHIGETRDISLALLDDGKSKDGKILPDNAATDGFALAFTGPSGSVAGVAIGEEELDASGEHLNESSLSEFVLRDFAGASPS
jgi:hypothetical protein